MQLCRFQQDTHPRCGFLENNRVLPIDDFAAVAGQKYLVDAIRMGELERLFPIESFQWYALQDLYEELGNNRAEASGLWLPRESFKLLPPIARPTKLLLLAGNYAEHIMEQGGVVSERERTFPYVFSKPASTTLVGDNAVVKIPVNSPDKIDHEVELAVIIGKSARNVSREKALNYVAGYSIINDLSDRGFRPNPSREERPRDKHFDWLHGKWHDGFCPCGPWLTTADEIPDPQKLSLRLWVDDELRQDGSTAQMIFDVASIIEFISSWMTLEPGDIISTGTPSGVGNASGKYLKAGQKVVAEVSGLGRLVTFLN
jgi:2,4-didehydro-3-deoxy-L-rhamnonate hydrolase